MKIRATELSSESRQAAGQWLKGLREQRGLSQSRLAGLIGSAHYTFISQLETGRSVIPSYYIAPLADALGCERSQFAKQLLQYSDPFMHAALFGDDAAFASALAKLTAVTDKEADDPTGAVLAALASRPGGSTAAELRPDVERRIGRELHHQSIAQILRKLEARGAARRAGRTWLPAAA